MYGGSSVERGIVIPKRLRSRADSIVIPSSQNGGLGPPGQSSQASRRVLNTLLAFCVLHVNGQAANRVVADRHVSKTRWRRAWHDGAVVQELQNVARIERGEQADLSGLAAIDLVLSSDLQRTPGQG